MITADLRRAVAAAAGTAGLPEDPGHAGRPGEIADAGLRDGGAPGRYATSLPLRLAARAGRDPVPVAESIAASLRERDWIETAQVTGRGYVTVAVTGDALDRLAVRIAEAGPGCARGDALRGRRASPPPPAPWTAAPAWPEAKKKLTAQVSACLATAAGATPSPFVNPERAWGGVRPPPAAGPVAEAVAFAGADAVAWTLVRMPPERSAVPDPRLVARHCPANPAYAVRYAHSCAASTLRWAADLGLSRGEAAEFRPGSLAHPRERVLLAALSWLPERVAQAARRGRPHEFAAYLEDLAATYQACRVCCPAWPVRGDGEAPGHPGEAGTVRARLWLAAAAAAGLAAGLGLLGVSAPERLLPAGEHVSTQLDPAQATDRYEGTTA